MITIDRKNKTAVDIAIHIPLPSFNIRISKDDTDVISNTELSYNPAREQAVQAEALHQEKEEEAQALRQESTAYVSSDRK